MSSKLKNYKKIQLVSCKSRCDVEEDYRPTDVNKKEIEDHFKGYGNFIQNSFYFFGLMNRNSTGSFCWFLFFVCNNKSVN